VAPAAAAFVLYHQVKLAQADSDACEASALLQATFSVSSMPTWLAHEASTEAASLLSYTRVASRSTQAAGMEAWLRLAHSHSAHEASSGPMIVFTASIVMTIVVACLWVYAWRNRARLSFAGGLQEVDGVLEPKTIETPSEPKQEAAPMDWTVYWLRVLVVATFGTMGVQVTLGTLARSVTLLGDLGHTAADAVTYLFASVVEAAKADLGRRGTAILDLLSAVFSILVVCSSSFYATEIAVRRLQAQAQQDDNEAHFGLIGYALLSFAVISTCVNAGVLLMHVWYKPKPCEQVRLATSDDTSTAVRQEQPQAPTSSPSAVPSRPTGQQQGLRCMQCSASGAGSRPRKLGFIPDTPSSSTEPPSSAAPTNNQAWIKSTVHALVHPGCAGDCQTGQQERVGSGEKSSIVESLNEYGVLLHLGADVVRSIVIFVTGVLVVAKVIPSASAADAITSLVVVSCVLAGSLIIVTRMPRSLNDAIYG